jgi:Zn-dependent protease with chaperone function
VTDGGDVRRLELALALSVLAMAAGAAIVMLDAIRFHAATFDPALRSGELHAEAVATLALAAVSAAAIAVTVATAVRQALAQRTLVQRLSRVGAHVVDGREVVVVAGAAPAAFCAGLVRPRIYVSAGTLRMLDGEQLRAVVAHEGHHADRRDPLRLLAATVVTAPLRAVPRLGALGRRHAILAELAADTAAVRSLGSPRALAAALLAFDERADVAAGVAPERVSHLLGDSATVRLPRVYVGVAAVGLTALVSLAVLLALLPTHPELPLGPAPLCMVAVSVCTSPVLLATRWRRRER